MYRLNTSPSVLPVGKAPAWVHEVQNTKALTAPLSNTEASGAMPAEEINVADGLALEGDCPFTSQACSRRGANILPGTGSEHQSIKS